MERDPSTGRWYLHSFYPEQPDLDWHNPDVVEAMQNVVRFWIERGVDGFRLDAIDRLVKDPELRDDPPSGEPFGLPLLEHELGRDLPNSRNAPGTDRALAALREAAGDDALLVGEVYLPTARAAPYLEHLDRCSCSSCCTPPGTRTCCGMRSAPPPRCAGAPARRRPGCFRTTTSGASRTASGARTSAPPRCCC